MLDEQTIHDQFAALMDKKAGRSLGALWQAGLLAGLSIGLAAYGYLMAQTAGAGKLGGAVMFCGGLVLVVLLQAELFTGNTILTAGAISKRFSWGRVLRNWGWVYVANFAASLLLAFALYAAGGVEHTHLGELAEKVMHAKTSRTVPAYLVRGILCNLLVVAAYLMALGARSASGKILAILFPVTLFVLCGFEHCVANMFLLPFGLLVEGIPLSEWAAPLLRNLIPVTAGNILGGSLILFLQPRFTKEMSRQLQNKQEKTND